MQETECSVDNGFTTVAAHSDKQHKVARHGVEQNSPVRIIQDLVVTIRE